MCLGIPGKIIRIYTKNEMLMGMIDFGGVTREVCLAATPEAKVDEYVIVHAGFGLTTLSEEEAKETLDLLKELGEIESEIDSENA